MAIKWFSLTVDAADPPMLARWWAEVLDYQVVFEEDSYSAIAKDEWTFPGIAFNRVGEDKVGKNRLHWDLNPIDQSAEVERLLAMGAVRADIGRDAPCRFRQPNTPGTKAGPSGGVDLRRVS